MREGVSLALVSASAFGLCDFVAGIAARRLSFWLVNVVSLLASAAGAWVLVGLRADPIGRSALVWGAFAGLGAAIGSTALYRGYGHGQMAVVGPLSAVAAAALPAAVGALLGERLPLVGVLGVLLALPSIWLMSVAGQTASTRVRSGVIDGLVSGVGFAMEFVGLERAGNTSGLWPVTISQTTALLLVGVIVAIRRPRWHRAGARMGVWAAVAGVLSLLATAMYYLAAHAGTLTVAAVLASLYPGVTVVLAAIFLQERPNWRQVGGLLLGAASVVLVVAS